MFTGEVEDGSNCKSGFSESGADASFDRGHRCQRCARDDASTGSGDPVILLNRFRGTLDTWDPAFVAALARRHRVVMFDSLGIGETGGHTPATVEATADFAARVIEALEFHAPAILGWSLGGFVAQVLAITRPKLLGKLVLVGPCRREARQKRSGAGNGWRQRATLCPRAT